MSKRAVFRPFAPKGLLSEIQTDQLKRWINGEKRTVSIDFLTKEIGISKQSLYNVMKKNPDRPFDELKLGIVNNLIRLFNKDIQVAKQEIKEAKETKSSKKRAKELIKKVGE
ncbi:hypothetical protein [Pediococcus pentosaceus]|uniref:hypothetical protein n=1 Tax=Pediococcus pentosaceus TaxID=1255 RepID=UPI0010481B76|nr:hypothetical protein [Pediococcus pentosaceus]